MHLSTSKQKPLNTGDLHPTERRWFAVRVGPRKEKVVARQLERSGIHHYLPLRERVFNYKRKSGTRQLPLLAGYLFVFVCKADYLAVISTTYLYGFIKIGREFRRVTEAEMELLRRISSDRSVSWEEVAEEEMLAGTPVEIATGPLAGVRGYYLEKKSKKTFVITFGGLDARLATCEVDPRNLIPLEGERLCVQPEETKGHKLRW